MKHCCIVSRVHLIFSGLITFTNNIVQFVQNNYIFSGDLQLILVAQYTLHLTTNIYMLVSLARQLLLHINIAKL